MLNHFILFSNSSKSGVINSEWSSKNWLRKIFHLRTKLVSNIGIGLITITVFLGLCSPAVASPKNRSQLSGLMSLRQLSQVAIPYEQAIANDKPTFIEFYADWCTTCQAMAPAIASIHKQYQDQVNFVMLDIDSPKWSEQIDQYQVNGVPQLTLLNTDHSVLKTHVGSMPHLIISQLLEQLVSTSATGF